MKKNIANSLLLLCSLIIMAGCHAKKQIVARTPVIATPAAPSVNTVNNSATAASAKLAAIKSKQVNFNTFAGRAKTKLDVNGDSNDATLNIRILRGQKIWVSVTYLIGIEVARALITPDSIIVMNKLQSVYFKKPFSYVYNYASKQVNYKTIESLLVGNAIPELLNDGGELTPEGGNTVLKGNLNDLLYRMIVGPDLKVSSANLANAAAGQSLQINYSEFIQATGRIIPSHISFVSKTRGKNIQADLNYNRADFDQTLEFPFSIPSRYSRVD